MPKQKTESPQKTAQAPVARPTVLETRDSPQPAKPDNLAQSLASSGIIGYLSESESYGVLLSINKASSEANIWPINHPLPVYVKDDGRNGFVIFSAMMTAPSTDLPSLSVIEGDKVYTIDPAKHFILESGLATLTAKAVMLNRRVIPKLMASMYLMNEADIVASWQANGFDHLKLVANGLPREHFMMFMQEFASRFAPKIKPDPDLRKNILRSLTEIGRTFGFFEDKDFLLVMRQFMAEDSVAVLLDQKTSDIRALLRDSGLKYGDL
nr:hypothetical protein [Candidatus Sigynarchaeota archaeon]